MTTRIKSIIKRYSFLILLFSIFTTLVSAEENFPYLGQITSDGVNIRAGQSASFEKIGQLKAGDPVVVFVKDFGWYKIQLPITSKTYITAKYIKELDKETGEVTADQVNIRSAAGEQFPVVGKAAKGEYVRILEKLDGWYRIEPTQESCGWINEGFVKFQAQEIPPKRTVAAPIRNIYAQKRAAEITAAAQAAQTPAQVAPTASEVKAVLAKPAEPPVFFSGVLDSLNERSIAKDIRHVVTGDNNTSYYLKGPQEIDSFLHRKVTVEGTIQSGITAPHPVVEVKKINLIL